MPASWISSCRLFELHQPTPNSEEPKIAHQLRGVGATFAALDLLITGIDPKTREWAAATPGARALLRTVLESGQDPREILEVLERTIQLKAKAKGPQTGRKGGGRSRKAG